MSLRIERVADASVMANMAVQRIEGLAAPALRERGRFVVITSGDPVALGVCQSWAERGRMDFTKVALILADDRAVPMADPGSRRSALQAAFTDRIAARNLPLPDVLAMEADAPDRAMAAAEFDHTLRGVAPSGQTDLVLLGLGAKGEVAGLMPGDPALREANTWCSATAPGAAGTGRFTLTLPLLTRGGAIFVFSAGADRGGALMRALQGRLDPEQVPAQFFLRDDRLTATLFADEESRAQLNPA